MCENDVKDWLGVHDIIVNNDFEFLLLQKLVDKHIVDVKYTRTTPTEYPEVCLFYRFATRSRLDTHHWYGEREQWEADLIDFIKILRA